MRRFVSLATLSGIARLCCQAAGIAGLAVASSFALNASAQTASPLRSFSVAPSCAGACSEPTLMQVDEGRVVALWSGEDDVWWAQSIEPKQANAVGLPERLGKLSVGRDALGRGLAAVPLSEGDLALFGTLADGRITYARGSTVSGRRVAAKALAPPSEGKVLSVAAAAHGEGIALLVLSSNQQAAKPKAETMELALSLLDGKGQALGPAVRWSAPVGGDARVAACGGQLYAAWRDTRRVAVRAVSSALALGTEQSLPSAQRLRGLSSIFCEGAEGRLLASYYRPGLSVEAASELYVAKFAVSAAGKPSWKKIKASGKPHPVFGVAGAIAAYQTARGLSVTLGTDGRAYTTFLDPKLTTFCSARVAHAASGNCLPLTDGKRVLCVRGENERLADACGRAKSVTFTLYGEEPEPTAVKSKISLPYFAPPQIEAADRPSSEQQAADARRLFCSDPAFEPLRKALDNWCATEAQKPAKERYQYQQAFCRPGTNTLQEQLEACSDHPGCPASRAARVPSVDRAELAQGTRVELKADNCSVWFERLKDGSFRLFDRECAGDI